MNSTLRWASLALLLLSTACSFTSTATSWNGLRDASGKPVYLKTTTNIGINLLVFVPLLGNTTIDSMVDETTSEIAKAGGTRVRTIQSASTNYSMAFWPFTLFVTPYVTEVIMEYEPSIEEINSVQLAETERLLRQKSRRENDTSHVMPPPR